MYQVLVAKNVAYAAGKAGGTAADPSELAPGAIGVFTSTGILLTAGNLATSLPDLKAFYFAVGTANGIAHSTLIQRNGVYDVRATEYQAPVKQVTTVSLGTAVFVRQDDTTAATPSFYNVNHGDELIVRTADETIANIKPNLQTYTVPAKLGDTLATMVTRLADSINRDNDAIVTATVAGTDLVLTGKTDYTAFKVSIDGVANNGGTIAYTTPHFAGAGTSNEIGALERLSQASTQMVHEQAGGRGATAVFLQATDGEKYDTYFIDSINRHHSKDAMDATYGRFIPVMVAFPDTATAAEGVFEGLLSGLINYNQATAPETAVVDASDAA